MSKVLIIGSGFSGLAAASFLAASGHDVQVFEKHNIPGGRARKFESNGFTFDMGPSWYWMPDVFERFFAQFGKKPDDYYSLKRLSPSYKVIFEDETIVLPSTEDEIFDLFEKLEAGGAQKLKQFLKEAKKKYDISMRDFVYKPSLSALEYFNLKALLNAPGLDLFTSMSKHVRKFFSNPKAIQILEFPVLFLGAKPSKTPAMYSLMNYADMQLGTWYPMGGMYQIIEGMYSLAKSLGVRFHFNSNITKIRVMHEEAVGLFNNDKFFEGDVVLSSADYHYTESELLAPEYQSYDETYWQSRTMAPSSLLYYLGINKKIKNLLHHNLFFDADFEKHTAEIYDDPKWPDNPLFYVCAPSITDPSVAPENMENIFLLVPLATGMSDTPNDRDSVFDKIIDRLESHVNEPIRDSIVFNRSYALNDFIEDYNALGGNAYGLANTLKQTAFMKPSMKSKKVKNLFYTGQLTVPGPGVPPSLISGEIAAELVNKYLKTKTTRNTASHEITV